VTEIDAVAIRGVENFAISDICYISVTVQDSPMISANVY